MGLSIWELLIILTIVFLVFGAKRLPELGSGLGKAIKSFNRGLKEDDKEDDKEDSPSEEKNP